MGADTDSQWRLLFPPSLRVFPADLTAVVVFTVVMGLVALLPVVRETVVRAAFALPFVLFVPGYAFIAALFPEAASAEEDASSSDDRRAGDSGAIEEKDGPGIDGLERVALSFGTSIAIVPVIGLILNVTPWGLRLLPILLSLSAFTFVAAYVGAQRRAALDPAERFEVPYERWIEQARTELYEPETQRDYALNVVMVVSLLLATGSVGFAVAFPKQGPAFSEFYLLTENETGELVADDYPTDFTAGEPQSLVVGIGNHEHTTTSYTVVTELQRVQVDGNNTTVVESERLYQFSPTVADNETRHRSHEVTPTMTGERLRLTYLLYKETPPPPDPTTENAYRSLRLWVNVSAPANETAASTFSAPPAATG